VQQAQIDQYDQAVLLWQDLFRDLIEFLPEDMPQEGSYEYEKINRKLRDRFPTYAVTQDKAAKRKRKFENFEADDMVDEEEELSDDDDIFAVKNPFTDVQPLRLLAITPKKARNMLFKYYWGAHQRFFRSLCISLKVDHAIKLANESLAANHSVVIGLQSTGEAGAEYEATSVTDADAKNTPGDFISAPEATLKRIILKLFPLPPVPAGKYQETWQELINNQKMNEKQKKKSNKKQKLPVSDDEMEDEVLASSSMKSQSQFIKKCEDEYVNHDSTEVIDLLSEDMDDVGATTSVAASNVTVMSPFGKSNSPVAFELSAPKTDEEVEFFIAYNARREYLERIRELNLPGNPLDILIDNLGGTSKVAEMTGRKRRFARNASGSIVYVSRTDNGIAQDKQNIWERQQFMDGKKKVAIISEAASSGISLHADRRVKNQSRRVHLTLELPWSADKSIQQLGRFVNSFITPLHPYSLVSY
jgi:hypothetical protein